MAKIFDYQLFHRPLPNIMTNSAEIESIWKKGRCILKEDYAVYRSVERVPVREQLY